VITISINVEDFDDLRKQLAGLVDAFDKVDEPDADLLMIGQTLRLARKDMDDLLWDYQNEVCDGQHTPVQDLIQRHSGELTLYHAPIDTWPAIAREAIAAVAKKRKGDY